MDIHVRGTQGALVSRKSTRRLKITLHSTYHVHMKWFVQQSFQFVCAIEPSHLTMSWRVHVHQVCARQLVICCLKRERETKEERQTCDFDETQKQLEQPPKPLCQLWRERHGQQIVKSSGFITNLIKLGNFWFFRLMHFKEQRLEGGLRSLRERHHHDGSVISCCLLEMLERLGCYCTTNRNKKASLYEYVVSCPHRKSQTH